MPIRDSSGRRLAPSEVRAFVGQGRIIAIRIPEANEGRHLDSVGTDAIVCAIPAMADGCTKSCEEPIRAFDAGHGIQLRGCSCIVDCRQPVDLLDIGPGNTVRESGVYRESGPAGILCNS